MPSRAHFNRHLISRTTYSAGLYFQNRLDILNGIIENFNALLVPESRIEPKTRGTLTMGLRVFALLRLGVEDSKQIATFLGLANSTVYNYRTKYRNEALSDRATFEERVKRL